MKKLLVKAELIDIPYSPAIEAVEAVEYQPEKWVKELEDGSLDEKLEEPMTEFVPAEPEKWVKDEEVLFEKPEDETGYVYHAAKPEIPSVSDESYVYHPEVQAVEGVEGVPEQPEVRSIHLLDQTQGMEEELQVWLSGNVHKYPENHFVEWVDLTEEWNKKLAIEAKIAIGKKAKEACQNVLDLISGYNLNRELTAEQISVMQTNFASIEKALQSGRPSLAKAYIAQIVPDEVLVTEEMKDMALLLLADY